MNKLKVTTDIRSILLADANIVSMVGDKVFPIIATNDTQGDFIVYQRDGYKQEYSKMGVAMQLPIVFVNAISDDYDRSQELASLIYDALSGTFDNPKMRITLEDSAEDYTEGKYIQILKFSIDC